MRLIVTPKLRVLHATTVVVGFALLSQASIAATPVFQHPSADGKVTFSDAPLTNGQMRRSTYTNAYGRPVATASCNGLTNEALAARANRYHDAIETAAQMHKVDAALVKAIAEVESCFDPKAVSRVGARGIMQLMPNTASELGVIDSFDAVQNIHGGTSYLARMLKRFDQNHRLALAAYNAGPGAVDKHKGVPPYPETMDYVKKVLKIYSTSSSDKS